MKKIQAAIIGPGNIGSDLMYKIKRSDVLDLKWMIGVVESKGILTARSFGVHTSIDGMEAMLNDKDVKIVFDATSAGPHIKNAPLFKAAGKIAIDLTPAAVGPYVVPAVNLNELQDVENFNMVTCGGQATTPIVYAIARAAGAAYAEIVSCISSRSAGPGTRLNIDEFTQTTSKALHIVGGAEKTKAIIVLNPAEPPINMTNTVYVHVKNPNQRDILKSVDEMVKVVQTYVKGYRLRVPPIVEGNLVTVIIEVQGRGDYLPQYAGNLDIMTSASLAVGETIARKFL